MVLEPLNHDGLAQAVARLRADMLLIYTLDTTFKTKDKSEFLSAISLGLSPTQKASMLVNIVAWASCPCD